MRPIFWISQDKQAELMAETILDQIKLWDNKDKDFDALGNNKDHSKECYVDQHATTSASAIKLMKSFTMCTTRLSTTSECRESIAGRPGSPVRRNCLHVEVEATLF